MMNNDINKQSVKSIDKLVLDTHIFIWYLEGINLTELEVKLIEENRVNNNLYISAITIWEVVMLINKKKIALSISFQEWLNKVLQIDGLNIMELSINILIESCNLPLYPHKDPSDRFIISTVRELSGYLLTHDQKILNYANEGYLNIC